ncbi:hypothetical protein [Clostridium ljungdahlii]|uniref:DUF3784 domain-containing protein n=1 Tax=Clostridium ljungdahlii TaxID=1538 RepID=A0A168MIT2_9CLOT|nr:hypothetical protein [Clostridium ljungdahlii]OAA84750.1 hypothetical protein WY13_02649 [Clostridium ljungdahlii]
MPEILLIIINFIVVMGIIKLIISKYSKYKINKFTFSKDLEKRQIKYNNIVIGLNLMFLFLLAYLESNLLIMVILTSIIAIIDVITVIRLGVFLRIKNNLNK